MRKKVILVAVCSVLWITGAFGGRPSKEDYAAVCTSPLGMESGAISDDNIDCSPSEVTNEHCSATCSGRYGKTYQASYWCRSNSSYGFFKVSFRDQIVVTGFAIESSKACQNCGIKKLYLRHGTGSSSTTEFVGNSTEKIVFEIDTDDKEIWLSKPIIAREVVIIPTEHNDNLYPYFYARFEFFGCAYQDFASAVGMQTGAIPDNQITLHQDGIGDNVFNPHAARLNSVMEGWKGSASTHHSSPSLRRTWLRIDLGKSYQILSIAVQQATLSVQQNLNYFIYYGESQFLLRPYTGNETEDYISGKTAMIITPPYTDVAYKDTKYHFMYPLFSHHIEYCPHQQSFGYPFVKLEFYGVNSLTATHSWSLQSNSLADEIRFQNLVSSEDLNLGEEGLSISNSLSSQLRTLPFHEDDCLVKPENCGSGFSVSFSAKVNEIPRGIFSSFTVSTMSTYHGGQCHSSGINSKEIFAIYVPNIEMRKASIIAADLEIFSMGSLPTNINFTSEVIVNKEESFVSSCGYMTAKKHNAHYVTMDRSSGTHKIDLMGLLYSVGSKVSLTIVFIPIMGNVADMNINSNIELKLEATPTADTELKYNTIASLTNASFSQNEDLCTDSLFDPSCAKINMEGVWRDCSNGGNYLEIDLMVSKEIVMLNVSGFTDGYIKEFNLRYSVDKTTWKEIHKYDDASQPEFVFKKSIDGYEFIPLPTIIKGRYIRIIPITTQGLYTQMKIELGTVEADVAVVNLKQDGVIARNGLLPWIFIYGYNNINYVHFFYQSPEKIIVTKGAYDHFHCDRSLSFKIDSDNTVCCIYSGDIKKRQVSILNNGANVVDFELTETDIYYVTTDFLVYRKRKDTASNTSPDESYDSGTAIKRIAVSTSGDLYGLDVTNSYVYKLDLNTPSTGWQLFSETDCSVFRVSVDNQLWCLKNGIVMMWDYDLNEWENALVTTSCDTFDVSEYHIVCIEIDENVVTIKRDLPDVEKVASYNATIPKVFISKDGEEVYALDTDTNCLMTHDMFGEWKPEFCGGDCVGVKEYDPNQYACIKTSGYTTMSNKEQYLFTRDNEPSKGTGYAQAQGVFVVLNGHIAYMYHKSGSYYNEYHYSMYHIAREIVYENYYNGPLFALLDEGDIYNFNVLYCNGPCESFQPTASHFYCLRDGHVYQSTKSQLSCSWNLVLSEVMCDSFDANDLFIICWVKGAGLYKKRIPSESGYQRPSPKFPIISSGFQRFSSTSFGTGFQVALSTLHSSLMVSVQTQTMLTEAIFQNHGRMDAWNDYKFVWKAQSNTLSMYINGTVVSTATGQQHIPKAVNHPMNFINFGGFYDQLSSYSQNFKIRDLKIWKRSLNMDEINSQNIKGIYGEFAATADIGCTAVAVDQSNETWFCSTPTGIYSHPMVHSLSVSLWEYHSNMTCNVMKHLMGYLLCISMDNYLLVWVSESWLKFRNAEALDVGLYPDEGYLIFIRKVDKHCKKFHFEDNLNCVLNQSSSPCPPTADYIENNCLSLGKSGEKLYMLRTNYLIYSRPSTASLSTFNCREKFAVNNHIIWCTYLKQIFRRSSGIWIPEMEQLCDDFIVSVNYILCVSDGRLYIKYREFSTDTITFDNTISRNGYVATGTCSRSPDATSACSDTELSKIAGVEPVYFYASIITSYHGAKGFCLKLGAEPVSVHNDEVMQEISNLPSTSKKGVYLPYYGGWEDGTPPDYFPYYHDKPDCKNKHCRYYYANDPDYDSKWFCDDCKQTLFARVCKIGGYLLQMSFPASVAKYANGTECVTMPYLPEMPLALATTDNPLREHTVLQFDLQKFPKRALISKAYLSYLGHGTSNVIEFEAYIGILNRSSSDCPSSDFIHNHLAYVAPVLWKIETHGHNHLKQSSDISNLLQYYVNTMPKSYPAKNMPLVVYWNNAQGTNSRWIRKLSLFVSYLHREADHFLIFPSNSMQVKFPPVSFETHVYSKNYQSFGFWYHMDGSDVGTLFVWLFDAADVENPHLAFIAQGNQGSKWKKAIITAPILNVQWRIKFLAYKRNDLSQDISIDTVDASPLRFEPESTEYIPTYKMNGGSSYLPRLKEYGLPQPKILFPFRKTYDGHAVYNKTLTGYDETSFAWSSDKFAFPYHALKVTRAANVLLEVSDISEIAAEVTTEFTVAFNLRFVLWDTPVTFCQFGSTASSGIEIIIEGDKLTIRNGGDDVYESSWNFVSDTWTYVGIIYKNKTLEVYYNNTLDDVRGAFDLVEFPTSLHMLRDPSKLGENDMFEGLVSCFQFYSEGMTAKQLEALEFCPDRVDPILCPRQCANHGHCSPLKAECDCIKTVERYYNRHNCENSVSTFRQSALLDLNFDLPNEKYKNSHMEKSPINYGQCSENSSEIFTNVTESSCLLDRNGCDSGFILSLWLYVQENRTLGDVTFFELGGLKISADFNFEVQSASNITGRIDWKANTMNCSMSFLLPMEAWTYVNIWMNEDNKNFKIRMNGEEIKGTGSCSTTNEESLNGMTALAIGNILKVCVDEIAVYKYKDYTKNSLVDFYNVITKHDKDPKVELHAVTDVGTSNDKRLHQFDQYLQSLPTFKNANYTMEISSVKDLDAYAVVTVNGLVTETMEQELTTFYSTIYFNVQYNITGHTATNGYYSYQAIKSSGNYFATMELFIESNILWTDELLNVRSEDYVAVNDTFIEVASKFMAKTKLHSYLYEFGKVQFIEFSSGLVSAFVDVSIEKYFDRFHADSLLGVHYFNGTNGFVFEIQRTNKTGPFPHTIEYSAAVFNDNTIQVNITNPEIINRRYHKGYFLRASLYYVYNDEWYHDEERTFYTGTNSFLYSHLTTYRWHHITIHALSHEGCSPSSNVTIIETPPSVNMKGPSFHNAYAQDSGIMLQWSHYPWWEWNAPHLYSYGVLYKPSNDINADNISTYDFVNISSSVTSFLLPDLEVYTEYNLYIGTTNDIGFGGLSNMRSVRTNPGPPEVTPNMTSIQLVDTTRVRFAWDPVPNDIELYNSPSMSNYVIKITPIHPSLTSEECQYFEHNTGPSTMSYELPTHCDPWHPFKVSIAMRNSAGYTGVENVYCYTLGRKAPGKLLVLNATIGIPLPDDLTSINITVGEVLVEHENTIITHYEVSYKSLDWEDKWKVVNVSIGHTEEFRNSLHDEKQYNMTCPDLIHSNSSANMTMPHSSHRVNYTLPALYYANYTIVARACGEEGCSALNISTRIRTAEHTPFCPPPNITLFNTSSTSLKVTFEEMSHACLSGQLQFYGLLLFETEEYAEFHLLTFEALKERAMYNESMETEFEFSNLNEYWNYTVVVFAQNNGGRGVLSKPVNAFTAEAAPDGVPQHCSVWHYNSSAIVLSVGKPERLLMNGLIHYEVVVRNQFGDEITRTLEQHGDITTTVFSNLTKFMYHNISIRAATVKGPGPEFMIYNRTLEDVPSLPPDNFGVHNVTNDTIIITWTDIPPLSIHGELQTYHVSGCGLLRNDTWHCFSKHVTNYYAKFTLFPGTMYRFTLSGCTNVGCGAETYLEQSLLEMVPSGTANNITAGAITTNSINITWTSVKPMEKRGDVIFYNVSLINVPHYWQSSSDVHELFLIRNQTLLQNGVMSLLFEDLNNHTSYRVSIAAYTAIGAGLTSEEVIYTTRQNIPSAYPENVTAFDTSSSSLNVSWLPLHPSDHEGILLGYNISYKVSEGFTDTRGGNTSGFLLCIGGDKSSCELTGLSLNTPFDIHVAGYTIRGVGPLSIMINVTTGEYVDGNWTSWTQWGSCSKSCGLGAEMRQRWCVEPKPEFGGNYCPGSAREYRSCNNFTCPGYYLANPGASCTETCRSLGSDFDCALNMNFQNKTSVFTSAIEVSDYTKLVNINCNTSAETISYQASVHPSYGINNGMCMGYSNIPLKIDCDAKPDVATRRLCRCLDNESTQYTEWANWGMCSKECGTGVYQRFRECIMANGCTGTDRAREDCNIDPCPVHGQWSQWSELSNCTKSCGFGDRLRTRTCTDPAPKFGGKDCEGGVDTEAFEGCNPMPCPRHGQWGAWHNVSECKHSCGDQGFKIQMRYCDNPSPLYGGNDCVGENNKTYPCEGNKPCIPAKYMFDVRFIDEVWEYPMYQLTNNRSVNLSRRIDNELRKFYGSSILSRITDDLVIKFHKMSKGSVIVLFSIEYQAVPHIESLILQHTVEGGMLNHMPVGLKHISVPSLPNGAPPTVEAESNSPYTIDVSWSSINMSIVNGNFFLYQVFFTKLDADTEEWDNFGTTDTNYTLIGLEPGALYGIRVLAATENGNGVASELIKIRTIEGVPYIKPPSCTYIIMNERTVYFSWDAIPPSQVPGVLRGYEIKFRKYHKEKENFAIADETMSQKTVFGFKPYTWYWVEVAGFTNAVERVGPHEVFVFRMPPGAPEIAPPNATAHSHYSTTEMLVTWDFIPKEDENGYLNGYRLYYRKYQQGGIDTVGEPFVVVTLDRFTKSYMMKGLESYTQYEITLYGYSAYGDGPSAVIYGDTCKCPKYIFNNWYERKPYVEQVTPDTAKGLFPELLTMVLNSVCMQCKSYLPTMYYNRTRDGRAAKKRNVDLVKKYIDENVHQSFPIFGRFELTRFGGVHPFIGIIQSQGSAMLVYQPKYNTVGFGTILSSVAAAWPVILIAVLLATMAGWVFWFLEQTAEESDLTQNRSIYGAFEGFWMCFITMTTLGYGDYVPAANISKAAMIFWILMGLCIVSIFGGAVSSGMSVGALATEYKLYGSTVAAVKNSFEFRTAILRNGIVDKQVNYTSILDVINAVSNRSVEIGLVDAISTQGYEKELEAKQVKIYKILDLNSGFGVVLSGEFARIENDMRSFVSSNQAKISMFVEKKIGILQPAILDVEELLLTPEESQSMLTKMLIAYVVMAFIGIVAWFLIVVRPKYAKVSPQDQIRSQQVDLHTCHEVVEKFKNDFTERMEQLEELHITERVELNDLKRNYAMHVRRGDIKPVPEQTEKRKKKKRRVPIESSA